MRNCSSMTYNLGGEKQKSFHIGVHMEARFGEMWNNQESKVN